MPDGERADAEATGADHWIQRYGQLPRHLEDVGEGWHPILAQLHEKVLALAPGYIVAEVKEKWGELRACLTLDPDLDENIPDDVRRRVQDLVDAAEAESRQTCEYCGKPGAPTAGGWIKTTCGAC